MRKQAKCQGILRGLRGESGRRNPVLESSSLLVSANPKGQNHRGSTMEAVGCIFAEASGGMEILDGNYRAAIELADSRSGR